MQYRLKLEPAILHFRFLMHHQYSLIGTLLNDIYITGATDNREAIQYMECWEFLMIMEHVEYQQYEKEEFKTLFYRYADLSIEEKNDQVMSLSRFSKLCMMKNYLSKETQKGYFKKYKISNNFNFDSFSMKFRSEYMVASSDDQNMITNLFYKIDYSEIDEKKLIDNINYTISHRHYFSMKGLQSTFLMLTNKANQIYSQFTVKYNILPEEYHFFIQMHDREVYEEDTKKYRNVQLLSL